MPDLDQWRHILAWGTSEGLAVPERDYWFPCYPFYVPQLTVLPCAVLQPGGPGGGDVTYIDDGERDDGSTMCAYMARFTLWFMFADPNSDDTASLLCDVVDRLHKGALNICAEHPDNEHAFRPFVWGASQVFEITYTEKNVLSVAVELSVPVT